MSLESSGVLKDHKHAGVSVSTKDVDTGAQLVAGLTSILDPDEAMRIRCVSETVCTSTSYDFVPGGRSIDISCP